MVESWFDSQCENLSKKMLTKLNSFRSSNSEYDRITYIQVKSDYSKLCDTKNLIFAKTILKNLILFAIQETGGNLKIL